MWDEWIKLGGVAGGLGIAAKLLWPLLSKRVEADGARAEADATVHTLLTDALKQIAALHLELAEMHTKLNTANSELVRLKDEVERLTDELNDARGKAGSRVGPI